MCAKDPYLFIALLIPGPKSPNNDLNVYLGPLIDELKMLWSVLTYDKSLKENFMMRADEGSFVMDNFRLFGIRR